MHEMVLFMLDRHGKISDLKLHDGKLGDVRVVIAGREIALRAGEQLLINDQNSPAASSRVKPSANSLPGIAIRGKRECDLSSEIKAFVCDFSLPSAMLRLSALSILKQSNLPEERALYNRMLKDAVALQTVTAAHKGAYSVKSM